MIFTFSFQHDYTLDRDKIKQKAFDHCCLLGWVPREEELEITVEVLDWVPHPVDGRSPQRCRVHVKAKVGQ